MGKLYRFVLSMILIVLISSGCMRFTERDYDLQKQAYEKERQIADERAKETLQMKW